VQVSYLLNRALKVQTPAVPERTDSQTEF
jgi:hypothetical protein